MDSWSKASGRVSSAKGTGLDTSPCPTAVSRWTPSPASVLEARRALSREMHLPTAEKPAFACLASRFPYGTTITEKKLAAVQTVEDALRENGIVQFRVRHHGDIARIEVVAEDLPKLCTEPIRSRLLARAKEAGYLYTTIDLQGYRTGSMNETLSAEEKDDVLKDFRSDLNH